MFHRAVFEEIQSIRYAATRTFYNHLKINQIRNKKLSLLKLFESQGDWYSKFRETNYKKIFHNGHSTEMLQMKTLLFFQLGYACYSSLLFTTG